MGKARLRGDARSRCVVKVIVYAVDGRGGWQIGLTILKSSFDGEPVLERKSGAERAKGIVFVEDVFDGGRAWTEPVKRDSLKAAMRAFEVHSEHLLGAQEA